MLYIWNNKHHVYNIKRFVCALVVFQSALSYIQQRKDIQRENERDLAELIGVSRVNEIMSVLHDTLKNRNDAEKEERERRENAEDRMKKLMSE